MLSVVVLRVVGGVGVCGAVWPNPSCVANKAAIATELLAASFKLGKSEGQIRMRWSLLDAENTRPPRAPIQTSVIKQRNVTIHPTVMILENEGRSVETHLSTQRHQT
jgi:hypothetical protein